MAVAWHLAGVKAMIQALRTTCFTLHSHGQGARHAPPPYPCLGSASAFDRMSYTRFFMRVAFISPSQAADTWNTSGSILTCRGEWGNSQWTLDECW